MRGTRRRSEILIASLVACAVAVTQGTSGAERPIEIPIRTRPPFILRAEGVPRVLPRHTETPLRLTIAGRVVDEPTHRPTLQELGLDLDRGFEFDFGSFPPCNGPSLDRTRERIGGNDEPDEVRAKCRSSIIAEGTASFVLEFPENVPIPVSSDLTLFMGDAREGVATMFLHAYLPIPTPQAVVAPVQLKRIHSGRYGTRLTVSLPRIAGGKGRLTSFRLVIPREARRKGEPLNPVAFRCADGRFQIAATPVFTDGPRTVATVIQSCDGPQA